VKCGEKEGSMINDEGQRNKNDISKIDWIGTVSNIQAGQMPSTLVGSRLNLS
jgi:hypothetical protein